MKRTDIVTEFLSCGNFPKSTIIMILRSKNEIFWDTMVILLFIFCYVMLMYCTQESADDSVHGEYGSSFRELLPPGD